MTVPAGVTIRAATQADWPALWGMLAPAFRAGDTYAVDPDISENAARAMWVGAPAATFIATGADDAPLGTYYIKANFAGRADHICNCGYITSPQAAGKGVATTMCTHSQSAARDLGFRAMQFNLVLGSNTRAVKLWHRLGYETIGQLPDAFRHPTLGMVNAHIMWKTL